MLDPTRMKLRVNPNEVSARATLERRKLREILNLCYSDYCFRAHILNYFGDRHHAPRCGTCGNCAPRRYPTSMPLLSDQPEARRAGKQSGNKKAGGNSLRPRKLGADETLRVRKILACAVRMKGRFGKHVLAATLRGSAAKNVLQAHLNELSTYGLLSDMKQDEILLYIDALVFAGCLGVTPGEYPLVVITEKGDAVMREREQVELALPQEPERIDTSQWQSGETTNFSKTAMETYALLRQGLSLAEIAKRRDCTMRTVEGHLADCIRSGLDVDLSRFVSQNERAQIEKVIATHGAERLKPLRDALPETISYSKIHFVIADLQRAGKIGT